MKRCVIVGAGFAGAVVAQQLAYNGYSVEIIEQRNHIAGNMYDYIDENGVLIHKYGPHTFHTKEKHIWDYIKGFSEWYEFIPTTTTYIDGKFVPFPFNFNSLDVLFSKSESQELKDRLVNLYGKGGEVIIFDLLSCKDVRLQELAEFLYEKDFRPYTQKQWGYAPDQVDKSVMARVPFKLSSDNATFKNEYQGLPRNGFVKLFENILNSKNISVVLNQNANNRILVDAKNKQIMLDGNICNIPVIYTGEIDALLKYEYGQLQYRSLEFIHKTMDTYPFQPTVGVFYPDEAFEYTRSMEYRHLMQEQPKTDKSSVVYERSLNYDHTAKIGNIPYYPQMTTEAAKAYAKYKDKLDGIQNLYLVGRLAEFKYYNMDQVVQKALAVAEIILKSGE